MRHFGASRDRGAAGQHGGWPDDSHPSIAAHYAERMKERAPEAPDRNLALELVRVTEAAAMTAARWVGRGDKNGADGAAVTMRTLVSSVSMDGVVVIGEGEGRCTNVVQRGARRRCSGAEVDVAVDPIDGTTLAAKGMPNAISVIAVAERGAMFDPSAVSICKSSSSG